MSRLIIRGGVPLRGSIEAAANKNAILPIMAACLLTDDECVLTNVPRISDVVVMGKILRDLGATVEGLGTTTLRICCREVNKWEVDKDLATAIRASILLAGPLLARLGKAKVPEPGGDFLGRRAVGTHLEAMTALGATITHGNYEFTAEAPAEGLTGAHIFLEEASVTATENTLMAATLAKSATVIDHAACEPHVSDLVEFLIKMGAEIDGLGSNKLTVHGGTSLHGAEHRIVPDHIDIGTFLVAAAITHGQITIRGIVPEHLTMTLLKAHRMGVQYRLTEHELTVLPSELVATRKIDTDPWPGFPTDLASVFITLATQATGTTLIHDWMYEGRMFFIERLVSMGANIVLCDPHRCLVSGPTTLIGREVSSPDLRAGMALALAALCAQGESEVTHSEHIERGYENIVDRLSSLGARIESRD